MYSWNLQVQSDSCDSFVYPRLGKVGTVRLELLMCGFTVDDLFNREYMIFAQHSRDSAMTLFLLRYGSVFSVSLYQL